MRHTHSQRLERWLGVEKVNSLSHDMRGWYGPPIAIGGVPGCVYATGDGDFIGEVRAGFEATWLDYAVDWKRRMDRGFRVMTRHSQSRVNAGFASLSELIAEMSAGKKRDFIYHKLGGTGATGFTTSLWRAGPLPQAGDAPAAAPDGTAFTSASGGGMPFVNPTGGDTQHIVSAVSVSSVASNTLLLYDLLFGCAKTMNSTANETVTGVPTRYQSTTPGAFDSAEGNFLFIQVGGTQLAASAHDWDACTYLDHGGAASNLPTVTGRSGASIDWIDDATAHRWFHPLEAGDRGIKALTNMHCSATVATGVIWFMIGHPLVLLPHPVANMFCQYDGINTSINLARVLDNACLALSELNKPATTFTNYSGIITTAWS